MNVTVYCFFILVLFQVSNLQAQIDPSYNQPDYLDLTDLPTLLKGKKADSTQNKSGLPEKGKLILFVVPIIGANPSLGTFYGVGGTAAKFLGDPQNTSISNLNGSILFTTKDQFVASLKGTIMTPKNAWEMLIDVRYSFFSENTFGLGSDYNQPIKESWNMGGVQSAGISGAQPLTFNYIRLHYTALKEIVDNVYAGIGYHLDSHYGIQDLTLDLNAPQPFITSHYAYSIDKGFNPEKYVTSGTSLNLVYDSRDHTINAYKGSFLQFAYRSNAKFLGSDKDSQQLYLEARVFRALSKEKPRHQIAFWGIGQFEVNGTMPYLDLPASGYDMRNRIGRGYVSGRFRGPGWVTAEAEYRFPLTQNGLLGGVVFASGTTTSRDAATVGTDQLPKLNLFDAIRPAGGIGARLMLNRTGRLNLTMDMAFGQHGAKGFYFAVGETF